MAQLTGFGSTFPGGTSEVYPMTSPISPIKPGTRARGLDGSEFVFCDFTATVYGRQAVLINSDWTATVLTVGGGHLDAMLGVACAGATSDQGGWVQIFGRCTMQIGINECSPSDAANGPTTVRTTAATIFVIPTSLTSPMTLGYTTGLALSSDSALYVVGISVATDVTIAGHTSGTTSATSHIGSEVDVFLNYPTIAILHGGS